MKTLLTLCLLLQSVPATTPAASVVEAETGCSAVVVGDELLVTAKHCLPDQMRHGTVLRFRTQQRTFLGSMISEIGEQDGPVWFRVPAGVAPGITLAAGPPPVGSRIQLIGVDRDMRSEGSVLGVHITQAYWPSENKYLTVESNKTDAVSRPGFSGGAAIVDGQLAGIVLSGDGISTSVSTWRALSQGYTAAQQLLQDLPVCKVYTQTACAPCQQFKTELDNGRFVNVPVRFQLVYVDRYPVAGIRATPTWEIDGERWPADHTGWQYDGRQLAEWCRAKAQALQGSIPRPVAPQPVPPAATGSAAVPVPRADPISAADPQSAPVVDIDWTGIRIIAMASDEAPVYASYLAGPANLAIRTLSGGQCQLEVLTESTTPNRFLGVHRALGTHEIAPPLQLVVLVDTIAEVGFVKGQVLKRIEQKIDEILPTDQFRIPIYPVLRRIHASDYRDVERALTLEDIPPATQPAKSVSPDKPDPTDTGGPVAVLLGLLGMTGARRVWKYATEWIHHSEPQPPPAASPSAPAAAPAPTTPAPQTVRL